jgi:hypothetical protein
MRQDAAESGLAKVSFSNVRMPVGVRAKRYG